MALTLFFKGQLEEELRMRPRTFEGDLETIEEELKTAKSAAAVLALKVKELQQNMFIGKPANYKMIEEIAIKFNIDAKATNELTRQLTLLGKEKAKTALKQLTMHLERSNKTSAMVMLKLKLLREGKEIGVPTQGPSPGSYLWEMQRVGKEMEREEREKRLAERAKARSRDRGGDRDRRDRSRDRDYERGRGGGRRHDDRDRDGERDRDRDRDRGRGPDDRGRDREADRGSRRDSGRDRHDDREYERGGRDRRDDRDYERGGRDRHDDRDYDRDHGRGGYHDRGGRDHGRGRDDSRTRRKRA
mmetsp:Transcript_22065/g.61815  ORF Transcript_22065/g.61815 Transcript_22065/m.61815 type:complete len:302 (-) Transcript_22065:217-1122(-)